MSTQLVIPRSTRVEGAALYLLTRTHLAYITRTEVVAGVVHVYLITPRATDSDRLLWSALEALTSHYGVVSLFDIADKVDDRTKQAVADATVRLFGLTGACS